MKNIAIILSLILACTLTAHAQQQSTSQLRRASQGTATSGNVTAAARSAQPSGRDDSDLQWMRTIYRSLSLQDDANAPLAFPEETADGGDNLFRTVMKLVASGKVPAYEFVDGRESFTPSRRVDPAESMRRFDIPFREAKGSTLKAPVYEVESADILSDDVKSYYLIERWEFNRHTNRMETRVEAICPVLHTDGDPHNTITPIARKNGEFFELDLVLRNNITTEEFPLGVYHPHQELHHIKKENIGLIEVMGLAVLPSRLREELELLGEYIVEGKDIDSNETIAKHGQWVKEFLPKYEAITEENVRDILRAEVGFVFEKVLEDSGVYKCTQQGRKFFERFLLKVGFER